MAEAQRQNSSRVPMRVRGLLEAQARRAPDHIALPASVAAGGSVVCTPGFLAPRFFEWMREFRPTWCAAAIEQASAAPTQQVAKDLRKDA